MSPLLCRAIHDVTCLDDFANTHDCDARAAALLLIAAASSGAVHDDGRKRNDLRASAFQVCTVWGSRVCVFHFAEQYPGALVILGIRLEVLPLAERPIVRAQAFHRVAATPT
eukprot:825833-Rhodomonas_salina.2